MPWRLALFLSFLGLAGRLHAGEQKPAIPVGETLKRDLPASKSHYVLCLPKGHDPRKSYEMIVAVHGAGQPAESYAQVWQPWAALRNAVLAVPESTDRQGYNWNPGDTVNIIAEAYEDLVKNYGGDKNRALLQGFSVGCAMGFVIISKRPGLFCCYGGMGFVVQSGLVDENELAQAADRVAVYYAVGKKDFNYPKYPASVDLLKKLKFNLVTEEPPIGHTIIRDECKAMFAHFDSVLKARQKADAGNKAKPSQK